MTLIAVAIVVMTLAVRSPTVRWLSPERAEAVALAVILGGLAWHVFLLLTRPPGYALEISPASLRVFRAGVVLGAGLVVGGLFLPGRLDRVSFLLVLGVHVALGIWLIRQSPGPGIDVYVWQDQAITALRSGENPYERAYPEAHPGTYPEELVADGEVSGYVYPPLTLLMALPAHLAGDLRYAYLVALEASALLIAFMRPGRLAPAAAALFLFTPGLFIVLQLSWTEPFLILAVAGAVYAASRKSTSIAAALFGLALGAKQYMVLSTALAHKLFGLPFQAGTHARRLLISGAVAIATLLPWLLWDFQALWTGLVEFPLKTPFRSDSFSFPAALARGGGGELPSWLGLVAAAVAWLLARTAPWTASGFCAGIALVLGSTFAWSTHSFSNYYFLVFAVLCCAVASAAPGVAPPQCQAAEEDPLTRAATPAPR
jgi:hypothetical protein